MKTYDEMDSLEREIFIHAEYSIKNKSFPELATMSHTYANKIRRDAVKLGVSIKTKSEAQKLALQSGRTKHPTKGTQRDINTKIQISEKRAQAWNKVTTDERKTISNRVKKQWKAITPEARTKFRKKATRAILDAAKNGSKLEKYLFDVLVQAGYYVEFHKEHMLANERLHLDLYLPKINIAIEVDGPSHYLPIWGTKTLQRNKKSDRVKNGLLLGKGLKLIRIKQLKQLTEKYKRDVGIGLLATLEQIVNNVTDERFFEI